MFITGICGPGLVYIGFSLIQIFIDIYNGVMNQAFLKFIIMLVFTLIINILCDLGFSVIAWFLVFIPIIMMTIISTLLLQVFGLDSENKNLNSRKITKDISNIDLIEPDISDSQESDFMKNNRIDRDELRIKFYDKIHNYYDLSYNNEHKYDLSNSPIKYNIVDNLINYFGEYTFVKNIVTSDLFNKIFSNALISNSDLYNKYNENRMYSTLEEINLINSFNSSNSSNINNGYNVINARDIVRRQTDNSNNELKYDHLNLNSYDINKTRAYMNSLNKDHNTVCPSNETPITYKFKTGLGCYEICAPGRIKDANGVCRNMNSYATI
jgi:hypothetical protein